MSYSSTVGLGTGNNRRKNIQNAIHHVKDQLEACMKEEVMLKPNFLSGSNPLVCTHVDAIRGVLDVIMTLKNKPKRILIAEGGNEAYSGEAFQHFGYTDLPDEYEIPISLIDLNRETRWRNTRVYMIDGSYKTVRMPRTVLDCPCVISVAVAKTHDSGIVTLALKNMIMGTILKKDRIKVHGFISHNDREHPNEARALNRNLIRLARHLYPDFSVVDGTIGIQGNGPGGTDTLLHGVAAASGDTVAVDAVISKSMGFEPLEIGTLYYADRLGMGIGDLNRIQVLGGDINAHIHPFKPHDSIVKQRLWQIEGAWEMAPTG
jgi:uncharacterized protein (DUF362 family)